MLTENIRVKLWQKRILNTYIFKRNLHISITETLKEETLKFENSWPVILKTITGLDDILRLTNCSHDQPLLLPYPSQNLLLLTSSFWLDLLSLKRIHSPFFEAKCIQRKYSRCFFSVTFFLLIVRWSEEQEGSVTWMNFKKFSMD